MEDGGTRLTLETMEKLAHAVGSDLVIAVGPGIAEENGIKSLVRSGHAVVHAATEP